MSVYVFTMVQETAPMSEPDRAFYKALSKEERHLLVQISQYSFCYCKLVQPSGSANTKPKWEVVERYDTIDDLTYESVRGNGYRYITFEERPYDPYGDTRYLLNNPLTEITVGAYSTSYEEEWAAYISRRETETRCAKRLALVGALRADVPWLPFRHPIWGRDPRIQLCQIRYLYPETATMPFPIALDFVRDKLEG